jgi:DNA-binding XRE family transcriptional regulator
MSTGPLPFFSLVGQSLEPPPFPFPVPEVVMTNEFTHFLRRRRQELAMTQSELAAACGLSSISITLIEAGRRRLALERIPRLAEVLQVPAGELCLLALRCRYPKLTEVLTTGAAL